MRIFFRPLMLLASVVAAHGQLNPLPSLATDDGAVIDTYPSTQTGWATSALSDYRLGAGNPFVTPSSGQTDPFGNSWSTTKPNIGMLGAGETVQVIFLGAGAPWLTAFGYTYSSTLTSPNSFTLDYANLNFAPSAFSFGDVADINLLQSGIATFDLWADTTLNAYTLFDRSNSQTGSGASANVLWTQSPLFIPTYVTTDGILEDTPTWIASVVETTSAGESHEFRFAVQGFGVSGGPLANASLSTPVPEPATYGGIGALLLAALALKRKLPRKPGLQT